MALKDWKRVKSNVTEIEYDNKHSNDAIHMVRAYPSLTWSVEVFDRKTGHAEFSGKLPQYDLTKKRALQIIKRYIKKN